jgi:hypothetical protein
MFFDDEDTTMPGSDANTGADTTGAGEATAPQEDNAPAEGSEASAEAPAAE